ncbi:phosphonate metabolism protein/1,5-bisphosphokinase (PRPP-forming) PhnN [Polaromonas sp.]|uniref:phosphonate metabolism protein/1,5-bisphosphokinase (PRPP-forming) PhnN n=1 Tax=Polaromonas sp. TaxID=1869339 RepID=UPI001E06D585|nr:phosphonate metabolism protein/1,5-bisphosphokinase (PRPP-forming) PhnN [Polaromonas sp.]MBT9476333.1 phosphonate metabolism protein/1,5-bisphosphokinase (PRPP-forming) PhnN [Polaromonas sp.]
MTTRLIYVVGASGSGKDSLMRYARDDLAGKQNVVFAHRYITRAADAGGENHVALSPDEFEARRKARLFAMHWQSHGHAYGIGIEVNQWLAKGITVVVNGSREYLLEAAKLYPELLPVWVEVSPEVLRERLEARGRESASDIEARLARHRAIDVDSRCGAVIRNDGELRVAGDALVELIRRHSGVVACA